MQQVIAELNSTYAAMIRRVKRQCNIRLDGLWQCVVTDSITTCSDTGVTQFDLAEVLSQFRPMFQSLRDDERRLFRERLTRVDKLALCQELYVQHSDIEEAMCVKLETVFDFSENVNSILFSKSIGRVLRQHRLRRDARLAIDEGKIIIDDAASKAKRCESHQMQEIADEWVWRMANTSLAVPKIS